jgi:hypothetical protein
MSSRFESASAAFGLALGATCVGLLAFAVLWVAWRIVT